MQVRLRGQGDEEKERERDDTKGNGGYEGGRMKERRGSGRLSWNSLGDDETWKLLRRNREWKREARSRGRRRGKREHRYLAIRIYADESLEGEEENDEGSRGEGRKSGVCIPKSDEEGRALVNVGKGAARTMLPRGRTESRTEIEREVEARSEQGGTGCWGR